MHERCPGCGYLIEREQGYFVGAIYINYAITGHHLSGRLSAHRNLLLAPGLAAQLIVWGGLCILIPLFSFRYSRAIWLNADYFFNRKLSPEDDGE